MGARVRANQGFRIASGRRYVPKQRHAEALTAELCWTTAQPPQYWFRSYASGDDGDGGDKRCNSTHLRKKS